jgi:hypothetical protein
LPVPTSNRTAGPCGFRPRNGVPRRAGVPAQASGVRMDLLVWMVLLVVWTAASSGTGLLLALLAKRIHPGLSLRKLWLFYTALMAVLVAAVFVIGWF